MAMEVSFIENHLTIKGSSVANSSCVVKFLILNKEGTSKKKSYERHDYKAEAKSPQSKVIQGKTPQILNPGVKS